MIRSYDFVSGVESTATELTTNIEDLSDVDIANEDVEDGQAIVWDDASSKWIAGASGDASFKVSQYSTSQLSVKAGGIIHDGKEYRAYGGTDTEAALLVANLIVSPTLTGTANYYLYIDTSAAVAGGVKTSDKGRVFYGVTNAMLMSTTSAPHVIDTTRYIPIGIYATTSGAIAASSDVVNVATRSVDSWSNIKLYESKEVAVYNSNAGQSIANSSSTFYIIDFEDAIISNSNITTGASWKYTAPRTGTYHVDVAILFSTYAFSIGNTIEIRLYRDGSNYQSLDRLEIDNTQDVYYSLKGSCTVNLTKNQYIDVRVLNDSSGAKSLLASSLNNQISIHEVTNYETSAVATPNNEFEIVYTSNPSGTVTDGWEKVLEHTAIHDGFTPEAYYWDASDTTNVGWQKIWLSMMAGDRFIKAKSSEMDALDWASGDKLKIKSGRGALVTAIPNNLQYAASAYRKTSAQTITAGSLTAVIFNTVEFDNSSCFSTSTGLYTSKKVGAYRVSYACDISWTTSPEKLSVYVLKNGTGKIYAKYATNDLTASKDRTFNGMCIINSVAIGDTLGVYVYTVTNNCNVEYTSGNADVSSVTIEYLGASIS